MAAKYAQHFLINQHAADRIVESLSLGANDHVIEIGPGKGALTGRLTGAKTLGVIEIDPEMVKILAKKFAAFPHVRIFHSDVLKFDFAGLPVTDPPYKVVGNLPYNLTSPILRRLADWSNWKEALIMVQKEVADRLCARVNTPAYGALTVGMSLICEAGFIFELSENSFQPRPRVKSAVVKLTRLEKPLTDDVDGAQMVIQAAFQQRRKTIQNSLSHGLQIDKTMVTNILTKHNIDPVWRAENVPVEKFVDLSRVFRSENLLKAR